MRAAMAKMGLTEHERSRKTKISVSLGVTMTRGSDGV